MHSEQLSTVDDYREKAGRAAERQEWTEAAVWLTKAIPLDPSAPLIVQYGHMLKEAGFLDAAVLAYRAARAWDGTATDSYLHLGHLLKRLDKTEEALEVFRSLETIPYAPWVRPEIDGLVVAQLNSKYSPRPSSPSACNDAANSMPGALLEQNKMLHAWLSDKFRRRDEVFAQGQATIRGKDRVLTRRKVPFIAEPMADLVMRGGGYCATTENPRLRLKPVDHAALKTLSEEWIEISVRISGTKCLVDPILVIEEQPGWAKFTTVRLIKRADQRFSAVTRLPKTIVSLRLDPVHSRGPFNVSEFRIARLSLFTAGAQIVRELDAPAQWVGLALNAIRRGGPRAVGELIAEHAVSTPKSPYERWIDIHEQPVEPLLPASSGPNAKIGFVTLTAKGDEVAYMATLTSLREQTSSLWEMIVVIDDSAPVSFQKLVAQDASKDGRVKSVLSMGETTAERLSAGAAKTDAALIGQLIPGDVLSPDAVAKFLHSSAVHPEMKIIYCDDDVVDEKGQRHSPRFKPDWNADYAYCYDYVGRSVLFSAASIKEVGGWRDTFPGKETYDLLLRLSRNSGRGAIVHLAQPLWHCPALPDAGDVTSVVNSLLDETGSGITAYAGYTQNTAKLVWPMPPEPPHVTIVIPTRDRIELLKVAIESILRQTDYPAFDIIVVDNGSTAAESLRYFADVQQDQSVSVVRDDGDFNFSRLNNVAFRLAKGSVFALVNNDVEVKDGSWLTEMVSIALDPAVGAVGAKLLYGSGHVQHAGILGGVGMVAAHGHKYASRDDHGYMNRLIVQQTVLAVTAACLVVEANKYFAVGGLDEDHLSVAFNDVDLCLKLAERGWRTVFTPWAVLDHHESLSRGLDTFGPRAARFRREADYMISKWGDKVLKDPFYTPNLTQDHEDFSLRLTPGNG